MRNYFPKRTSGSTLHILSKLYMMFSLVLIEAVQRDIRSEKVGKTVAGMGKNCRTIESLSKFQVSRRVSVPYLHDTNPFPVASAPWKPNRS